jgi:hypothetical protein
MPLADPIWDEDYFEQLLPSLVSTEAREYLFACLEAVLNSNFDGLAHAVEKGQQASR